MMDAVVTEHQPRVHAQMYAALTVDSQKLLLPQSEIRALEPVSDIDRRAKLPGTVGWIAIENKKWPVYSMGKDLAVLDGMPKTRRVCVLLNGGENHFAITCDTIGTVKSEQLIFHPLPVCMSTRNSPVLALAIWGTEVSCLTTASRLAAFTVHYGNLERSNV